MHVGLSFFVRKGARSIWDNGGSQHCIFLLDTLRAVPGVDRVTAINAGDGDVPHPAAKLDGIEFKRLEEVVDDVDVLVEAEAQLDHDLLARHHARGGKLVAMKFGNGYVIDTERMIRGERAGAIFDGSHYDAVWTNAQHVDTCRSYWETMYRAPVVCMPHVWDRRFVDLAVSEFPRDLEFGPRPHAGPFRVGIFEPNINLIKTCVVPILACERAHRAGLDVDAYVLCAERIKENDGFKALVQQLDIYRAGRLSFEARYRTPWFLARYCDAVVSHQWENALNYLYYEVLAGGYPLVHNSPLLHEFGQTYGGFDADDAADAIMRAAAGEPMADPAAFLASLDPVGRVAVDAHRIALERITATGARAAA